MAVTNASPFGVDNFEQSAKSKLHSIRKCIEIFLHGPKFGCMLSLAQYTNTEKCTPEMSKYFHFHFVNSKLRETTNLTCPKFEIPSTKQMESNMLDLPVPLRPVMAVNSLSKPSISVRFPYDLNPSKISFFTHIFAVPLQLLAKISYVSMRLSNWIDENLPLFQRNTKRKICFCCWRLFLYLNAECVRIRLCWNFKSEQQMCVNCHRGGLLCACVSVRVFASLCERSLYVVRYGNASMGAFKTPSAMWTHHPFLYLRKNLKSNCRWVFCRFL